MGEWRYCKHCHDRFEADFAAQWLCWPCWRILNPPRIVSPDG
jgi:hypothetical protein